MYTQFLKGKVAVITGSLSGIGWGMAKSLSAAGAHIVLNGFAEQDQITRCEKEITNATIQGKFIFADLTKQEDCKSLIENSIKHFGKVDILINNAGMQHVDAVENFPEEMWRKVIDLNLSSCFYTTKYALPQMKKNGWGRVINVSSVHGLVGSVNKSAYVSSKHGVVGLTKVCALENAKTGVTFNTICPGFVLTPLIQRQIDIIAEQRKISNEEASKALISQKAPSASFNMPEDIGDLATFICSNAAAQAMGTTFTMDGGWTSQ